MQYREILYAVLLTGCLHEQSFLEQVHAASDRWEHAICRAPRYALVSLLPSIDVCSGVKNNFYGCYDRSTATIQISMKIPNTPGLRYQVITHEMGHSLGPSHHLGDWQGLMSPYSDSALHVLTNEDLDLICKEYECPCRNPEAP